MPEKMLHILKHEGGRLVVVEDVDELLRADARAARGCQPLSAFWILRSAF
jgi:hypothetical protein